MPPADPAPATPDWIARALGSYESGADFDSCYLENTYYEVPKREIVRILATLRERTLREAAGLFPGNGDVVSSILSLIAQPPKEAT